MPSRQLLMRTAKGLVERLLPSRFAEDSATESHGDSRPTSPSDNVSTEGNLALDLEQAISMTTTPVSDESRESDLMKVLTKEFSLFEATHKRPPHLQQLFDALHSVQATSVEAERAFSICGQFVTKLRNRLSAESIDALCFLKAHFQKQKKASEC